MKKLFIILAAFLTCLPAIAQKYAVIASESRIYDKPNVKSYATTNTSGQDIVLSPGMVFPVSDAPQAGWDKIEYTPGLKAFILSSQLAQTSQLSLPKAGEYSIANNPGKRVSVTETGGNWTLTSDGKEFKGIGIDKTVVFKDQFSNPAFSIAVFSGKTYVFSYDNEITKFF